LIFNNFSSYVGYIYGTSFNSCTTYTSSGVNNYLTYLCGAFMLIIYFEEYLKLSNIFLKVYAATMFIIFSTKEFLCKFVDDDDVLGFYAM
jgi:hypothetical protein